MPIKKLVRDAPPGADELVARLGDEWRSPGDATDAPVIVEEPVPRVADAIRLYVIWDRWGQLPLVRRSELIMDAYESGHTEQEASRVTSALGLTHAEARRMGLRYE